MKIKFGEILIPTWLLALAVNLPAQPIITNQPTSQTVVLGGTAVFNVGVTGVGPFTYQWQLNGTNLPNNIITTVAGNGSFSGNLGDGGSSMIASLNAPSSLAVDVTGNVYIADRGNNCIRKLGTNGIITRIAGDGTAGYNVDSGPAKFAIFNYPFSIALDSFGNLFIADMQNSRLRKIDTNSNISTVASGLLFPSGVAIDAAGNVFIAEQGRHCIRKLDTNGVMTIVAGVYGTSGYSGDGGLATNANLNFPTGVAADAAGNLFVIDYSNDVIRKVDTNGVITTFAGNGTLGYSGDGGAATNASLYNPASAWVDIGGNLLIPDQFNNRIRKVDTNGIISTVAGNGQIGILADGGPATSGRINAPLGVVSDAAGNLYIADTADNLLRKVDTNGIITTIAGNGTTVYTGDSGNALSARLGSPVGVSPDSTGNIFIYG